MTVGGVEVLQASTGSGLPVGVVDTPDEQTLLDCIAGGHSYQAEIKRISGGAIAVLITRI